jgi:hypothetical protein
MRVALRVSVAPRAILRQRGTTLTLMVVGASVCLHLTFPLWSGAAALRMEVSRWFEIGLGGTVGLVGRGGGGGWR